MPPPPLRPIQLSVAVRCRCFYHFVITPVPRHARRRIGPTMPLGNPAFSPANSRLPGRVPTQAVCLDCQISHKVRCISQVQSRQLPPDPANSFGSCPPTHESAHPSRYVCCPRHRHQEVCARSPDRRTRPRSPGGRKSPPCRFHPRQSAAGTFLANALLHNQAWLRQGSLAPVQTARIPPRLCPEREPLVLSRKPRRLTCSSDRRKSSIPSART